MSHAMIARDARRPAEGVRLPTAARASWAQTVLGAMGLALVLMSIVSTALPLPRPEPTADAMPTGAWRHDPDNAWIAVHAGTFKIKNARLEGRALAVAYYERGNAYHAMRDHESALADYTVAIQTDAAFAEPYIMRGLVQQAMGRIDRSIADYTAAIAANPDLAVAYFNRAIALHGQGHLQDAVTDFARAAKRGHAGARAALDELGAPAAQAER